MFRILGSLLLLLVVVVVVQYLDSFLFSRFIYHSFLYICIVILSINKIPVQCIVPQRTPLLYITRCVVSCTCFVNDNDLCPGHGMMSARAHAIKCAFLGYSHFKKRYCCHSYHTHWFIGSIPLCNIWFPWFLISLIPQSQLIFVSFYLF